MAKDIVVKIFGEADFSAAQSKISAAFGSIGKVAVAGMAVAGTAVAAGAVGAFKLGQSFEEASREIAVATGATGEKLDGLNDSFDEIAKNVPNSFGEVAGIVGDLNTLLGLTGPELEGLGIQLADGARLLGEDANGVTNSFGKLGKQIGLTSDEVGPFADGIFKLTQDFGIGFQALTDQVATVRPALQFAFNDQEIAGFVASLDSVGVSATSIQGPFSKFLKSAAEAGEEPRAAFDSLVEGIQGATSESEALSLGFEAFGSKGAPLLVAALREGTISLDDLGAAFEGTEGLIGDTNKELQSIGERFDEFKNKVAVALRPVASTVFDAVDNAIKVVLPRIEQFVGAIQTAIAFFRGDAEAGDQYFENLLGGSALLEIGSRVGVLVATVIDQVGNLFDFFKGQGDGIGGSLSGITDAISTALEALNAFVASLGSSFGEDNGSTGLVLFAERAGQAVTLLFSAFQVVVGILPQVIAGFTLVAGVVGDVVGFIVGNEALLIGALTGLGVAVAAVLVPAFIAWAAGAAAAAAATLIAAAPFIAIGVAVAAVAAALVWAYQNVEFFRAGVDLIVSVAQSAIGWLLDLGGQIIEWVSSIDFTPALDGLILVWSAMQVAIDFYMEYVRNVIAVVMAVINGDWSAAWDAIKSVLSLAWDAIQALLSAGWEIVKALFASGATVLRTTWGGLWDAVKAAVSAAWSAITSSVTSGVNRVASAFRALPGKIRSAASGMWNVIYDQFKAVLDRVRNLWNALDFKIPEVNIPGVGSVGGGSISGLVGRLPFFANGNVATSPTLGVFGEYAGARSNPEITTPERTMENLFRRVLSERGTGSGPGVSIGQVVVPEGRSAFQEIDQLVRLNGLASV